MTRWRITLLGLFLTVFAIASLSGPGRTDSIDGLTRFEVACSLVDHGDSVIRNDNVWFSVFPGRDGQRYSTYRFPQSVLGAVAVLISDATGPIQGVRRRFFFSLTSPFAAACMAVCYAALFRRLGHSPRGAVFWAAAGVFCTPSWFYGTSLYDDILGSATVVFALTAALLGRRRRPWLGATLSGLAMGLAFNCKQPLALFTLPVLAAIHDPERDWRAQRGRYAVVLGLLALGIFVQQAYERIKFPPGFTDARDFMQAMYVPVWTDDPTPAMLAMTLSLGCGVLFYNAPILLSVAGLKTWRRTEELFATALVVASMLFFLFICCLTFYKGDNAWGPRYLTPVFAVLWILAPAGAWATRRWAVVAQLAVGLLVQIGALSLDPQRLYMERALASGFYLKDPTIYFDPSIAHVIQRPREIWSVFTSCYRPNEVFEAFEPDGKPTRGYLVNGRVEYGASGLLKYNTMNSFRPWWAHFGLFFKKQPPVDVPRTAILFAAIAAAGSVLTAIGLSAPIRLAEIETPAIILDDRPREGFAAV
ncbi:glycosyltransferase family 39 protein [Paludisphaera borealis]|uniref:Uncharacterized protein n=1 Tax=Paludisphaera borealis TaxID=1387353 RepID=A0A1U7CQ15_9BACT|nr:glycosyltransferase family 39 protein [Paludisphaera borealis]APW61035.1 hypothetical protein BSF38_02538 [Paludisphaera borealis]